jgi:hypothetical protein
MANKIPLKATYSGSNTSGLAEFQSGDTIDAGFISGGLAPLASPTFTGTPAAPTAAVATNTTQLATTAFVRGEVTALVDSAPGTLDTLNELAAALGDDANFSTTVTNSIATKLSLSGGAMTGAITTNSTFDGVDIAVRDAVLTSTTTTANAALPKAGGTVTGNLIMQNNINLGDNNRLYVGNSNDLSIYHSGSHSVIAEAGTGNLLIQAIDLTLGSTTGESHATFVNNGAATLFYDNSAKLATTSEGITVTGGVTLTGGLTADTIGWDTSEYIQHSNNANIGFIVNGNEEMRIEADGDLHADGDVIAYSTTISDLRLKENIQPIEDALHKVNQLTGYTFTYTVDGRESAGLIAQEVEKVLPSAVSEKELPLKIDDGKEYKVLQYDQTIGLLVEAVKELSARIEELESK